MAILGLRQWTMDGPYQPAIGSAADPNFANVVLLCGFDGTDGATTAPDESSSAKTLTFVGDAQIDTAQSVFGGASLLLDGSGDRVTVPDSVDWQLGASNSDPWTVECRVRFSTVAAGFAQIVGQNIPGTNNRGWQVERNAANLEFWWSTAGSAWQNFACSGVTFVANQWYALCVDKDAAGKIRAYVDGVMKGSATPANSGIFNSTAPLSIGATGSAAEQLAGWIDELRVTKGVARYASDGGYTVAAAAFPRS